MRIMIMDGQGGGEGTVSGGGTDRSGNQRHSYGEYDEERRYKRCHRGECRGI